ncbi:MAG TPA: hypothetical protein VFQ42_19190 [Mycobacterium sp.]|nr:hypothetical protein [Mycobacterium sp.]
MSAELTWKNPPPATTTDWRKVDSELRSKPGQWARVAVKSNRRGAAGLAAHLRHGASRGPERPRQVFLELGAFEVQTRGCEVYVRYVGTDAKAAAR